MGRPQPSYHSGRRHVLSPRDEHTLVRKVQINPRTTAKDLVKIDITPKAAQQGRSHCSKSAIKKARLRFATAHGDKDCAFWRNVLWLASRRIPSEP
ncbi:unnamed protein product [Oncorhynchus mykiss]|uniref:Transposase Tc1-like domain-containing protein n=1 Tax=Oncorhynchus mykiss TaxID=8022 RepID=A0A060YWX7_ONCMY|nr:unnamed protein product [Oncorhynchus mykiss]